MSGPEALKIFMLILSFGMMAILIGISIYAAIGFRKLRREFNGKRQI